MLRKKEEGEGEGEEEEEEEEEGEEEEEEEEEGRRSRVGRKFPILYIQTPDPPPQRPLC